MEAAVAVEGICRVCGQCSCRGKLSRPCLWSREMSRLWEAKGEATVEVESVAQGNRGRLKIHDQVSEVEVKMNSEL